MIPPEPEPEPPVPEPTADYTYLSHTTVPVGPYSADFYSYLQDSNGDSCYLAVIVDGTTSVQLRNLCIVDVTAFDQVNHYFCSGDLSVCIYTDNASVGGTHPYYAYDAINDTFVEAGTAEIVSCTPLDLFSKVDSGDFTLEQRQTRGEVHESDLYYD